MEPDQLILRLTVTILPLILAITVHEWAHVAMARFLGDDTGTRLGRFTLNPLAHIDPVWTVALPAMLVILGSGGSLPFFAAGKPAPYNPGQLTRSVGGRRISLRKGELLVAAAGPASNLVLATLCTVVLAVAVRAGVDITDPYSPVTLLRGFIVLNLALFVFNLIPIPPLDGSKVLMNVLPRGLAYRYERVAGSLSWVLLLVVIFAGGAIIRPIVGLLTGILSLLL